MRACVRAGKYCNTNVPIYSDKMANCVKARSHERVVFHLIGRHIVALQRARQCNQLYNLQSVKKLVIGCSGHTACPSLWWEDY